jgi:hypothetical protein
MSSKGEGSADQGNEGANDRACGHSSTQRIMQKGNGETAQTKRADSRNGNYTSGEIFRIMHENPLIIIGCNQCRHGISIKYFREEIITHIGMQQMGKLT